jgi:hypothetical protein
VLVFGVHKAAPSFYDVIPARACPTRLRLECDRYYYLITIESNGNNTAGVSMLH